MYDILKLNDWKEYNKSTIFLLPLTGLSKAQKYRMDSFLFWDEYSIEDYILLIRVKYDSYSDFLKYAKKVIFPILDKNNYLVESHDYDNETVLVLDMSEWALDIEMFLKGKYSKFSKEAKYMIKNYYTYFDNGPKIVGYVDYTINPNEKKATLDNKTPIDYIVELYNLDSDSVRKIGEITNIYNKEDETLKTIRGV